MANSGAAVTSRNTPTQIRRTAGGAVPDCWWQTRAEGSSEICLGVRRTISDLPSPPRWHWISLVGDDVVLAEEELVWIVAIPDVCRHVVIGLDEQVAGGVPGERLDAVGLERFTVHREVVLDDPRHLVAVHLDCDHVHLQVRLEHLVGLSC